MSGGLLSKVFVEIGYKGFDKIDKYMSNAVASFKNGVGTINNVLSSMNSVVGSASPLAVNTFNASLEVLKARVGQQLTPFVLQSAKAIQDLSNWIKNLDPEMKKSIANWVMYGTAAAGAFAVLNAGLHVVKAVAANPLALVLLTTAAAAIKVSQDMDKMVKSMDAAIERGERMKKGIYTAKEFAGSTAEAIYNDPEMSREQKIDKAKELRDRLTSQAKEINAANSNDTFGKQAKTTGIKVSSMLFGTEDTVASDAKKSGNLINEIAMLTDTINKLSENKAVEFTDESKLPTKKKGSDNRLLLGALGGSGSAGVSSLDGSYNKLNSAALGGNDLQRELLKIQQETLIETQNQAKDTTSILDTLRRAFGI